MTSIQRRLVVALLALSCAAAWLPHASGQEEQPPAPNDVREMQQPAGEVEDTKTKMSWDEIIESGGVIMYVLGAMSVLTLAMVIYFFVVLRAPQVVPRALHRELMEKLRAGHVDEARRTCDYKPSPLSAVCLAAIDHLRDLPEAGPLMLKDVVEGEGQRQSETIQGQTQYLMDVAVVAPMVGLLGTVLGMLQAFSGIALEIDRAKPVVLAAGVSQALITTAFGLIVGIPAMAFYAYFRRRASKLVSHLEIASTDVLTALLSKKPE